LNSQLISRPEGTVYYLIYLGHSVRIDSVYMSLIKF
jgi:hypothetical protein